MKKALAIAGILALSITPTASFADHLEPKESEIRARGNLFHTNLRGRKLTNADLFRANLRLADLRGANLRRADLRRADLRRADLSGANLVVADLSLADLRGANLSGISATNLRGCPSFLPSGWVCKNKSLIQK